MSEVPVTSLKPEEKTFGMLAHLLGIFTGFVGALVIWLIKKEESPWVDKQAKEALNFQISIAIYFFVAFLTTFILIGAILMPLVYIFNLVFCIIATIKANNGEEYSYPLCIRLIK